MNTQSNSNESPILSRNKNPLKYEEKTQEIQLTLDRETAQKLHDLLMAQLATSNDTEGGDVQPVAQDMDSDQLPAEDEEEAA